MKGTLHEATTPNANQLLMEALVLLACCYYSCHKCLSIAAHVSANYHA